MVGYKSRQGGHWLHASGRVKSQREVQRRRLQVRVVVISLPCTGASRVVLRGPRMAIRESRPHSGGWPGV